MVEPPIPLNPDAEPNAEALRRCAAASLWLTLAVFAGLVFSLWVLSAMWAPLFSAMEVLLFFGAVVLLVQNRWITSASVDTSDALYRAELEAKRAAGGAGQSDPIPLEKNARSRFRNWLQWIYYGLGLVLLIVISQPEPTVRGPLAEISPPLLRTAAVGYAVLGCLLFFFTNYAATVAQRVGSRVLASSIAMARLLWLGCFTTTLCAFLFLVTQRDYNPWLAWIFFALAAVLIAEPLVRLAVRSYQPRALRPPQAIIGESLILDVLSGRGGSVRASISAFESLLNVKIGDVWVFRYVRASFEAIIVATALFAWLSTSLNAVPAGSVGVRAVFGKYERTPLSPGLHLSWPWPLASVQIVNTGRIRDMALGYEKDLSGPLLWDEAHFSGEKNLLVGNGETLLSINVPIYYRVADPVRFLERTSDAEQALRRLAERKLLEIAQVDDAFQIMTTDRGAMAQRLQNGLQAEVDRLGLGIEIVFVGLKDVHPPVSVAPAYQNVVSAEEQKDRMIDEAKAYAAKTLPAAKAQADRLVQQAQGLYATRVGQARGESTRFSLVQKAELATPDLYQTRLRLDAISAALAKPTKIILATPANTRSGFYLDLRNTGEIPPP